jgi:hypothetical protein
MRRRDFIAILAGGMAFPLVGRAPEPGRTYRLGFLVPPPRKSPVVAAFLDELRLNGFVEGDNLIVIPGGFEVTDERLAGEAVALINAPRCDRCWPRASLAGAPGLNSHCAPDWNDRGHGCVGIRQVACKSRRQYYRHQPALAGT